MKQLQHHLQVTLADISGTVNIADGFLISNKTIPEHDKILKEVFDRLYKKGLNLNLTKSVFSKEY